LEIIIIMVVVVAVAASAAAGAAAVVEVISEVKSWLQQKPAGWYHKRIQALTSRWGRIIDLEGEYVEKYV
jgi:opacity protein-like surface antigen